VRRRIYAAHLTVYRGIIEQLEQVEIDAFPTAFVTKAVANRGLELNQTEKEVRRSRGTVKAASAPVLFWMVDRG
jgi:hypothetical protein